MIKPTDKLEFTYEREGTGVRVTLPVDATLEEALEGIEMFLSAAGYVFDGHIEINGNIQRKDDDLYDPNAEKN